MVNQAYPTLNGIEPSWADIGFTFSIPNSAVIQMSDIAALKWGRKVEVGKKRGASGGRVMARTTGQSDYDCTATLYRTGYETLISDLSDIAPTRGTQCLVSLVAFDILVQYTPPGSSEIFQVKIKGCRLLGDSDDAKEGTDPDKVECTLDPIEIANIQDGLEIVML